MMERIINRTVIKNIIFHLARHCVINHLINSTWGWFFEIRKTDKKSGHAQSADDQKNDKFF
jgi:hypothetical protein